MRKTLITALILTGCFSVTVQAASFDCAKASTATEKLICTDAKISVLDEQLASAYKAASETAIDKNLLKNQQRDWLKQKRNICEGADCLVQVYQLRIDQLTRSSGLIDSCYSYTQQIKDFSANEERYSPATDFIKIFSRDAETITFELKLYGGNFHVCSVPGFAYRVEKLDGVYKFKDEKKYWIGGFESYGFSEGEEVCEVIFNISEDETKISSKGNCRGFCGARARIGGQVLKKSKNCSDFSSH